MMRYNCAHCGTPHEHLGEGNLLLCGCTGEKHVACRPVRASDGTPRPAGWPVFLAWPPSWAPVPVSRRAK